jgi:predicted helicase
MEAAHSRREAVTDTRLRRTAERLVELARGRSDSGAIARAAVTLRRQLAPRGASGEAGLVWQRGTALAAAWAAWVGDSVDPPLDSDVVREARRLLGVHPPGRSPGGMLAADPPDPLLAHIADRFQTPDPHLVFWESMLASEDPNQRRALGAFFTPGPAAQYLIQSVQHWCEQWFRDCLLTVIDPACGSGVFLQGLLRSAKNGQRPPLAARPLLGLEVDPATSVVAHWATRRFPADVAIRCVDALQLESPTEFRLPPGGIPVFIGNPPYAAFGNAPVGRYLTAHLQRYRRGVAERKSQLHDRCLQFLAWAHRHVELAGRGIIALVINHALLSAMTHRGLRRELLRDFDQVRAFDLHGNSLKRERGPGGTRDENIFGIRSGVCLLLLLRHGESGTASVAFAELWGRRDEKLNRLTGRSIANTEWQPVDAAEPSWSFRVAARPSDRYASWPALNEIFREFISGVQTKCDRLFVDFCPQVLLDRLRAARDGRQALELPASVWNRIRGQPIAADRIRPYYVAPLDRRWVYYDPELLGRGRYEVMRHLCHHQPNPALGFMRQSTNPGLYDHALIVDQLVSDRVFYSGHGAPYLAPQWLFQQRQRLVNVRPEYLAELGCRIDEPDARSPWLAQRVFPFLAATLLSPRYRSEFSEALATGFPRIPWPASRSAFQRLARQGAGAIRLLTSQPAASSADTAAIANPRRRGFPRWRLRDCSASRRGVVETDENVALGLVTERAWQHRIGGYQVLRRWLKQRQGRPLTAADQHQFLHMAGTLDGLSDLIDL